MERRGQNNDLHYDLFIKQVHSNSIFNIAFNYLLSPPRIHVSITLLYLYFIYQKMAVIYHKAFSKFIKL